LVAIFLVEVLFAVWKQFPAASTHPAARLEAGPAAIGHLLFSHYVLPFEVTSILILVAILGAVVLAKKEYESWFLAAAQSLRGQRGLPADLATPATPESIRGAKEWLRKHLPSSRKYSETLDQPELTRYFDLQQARKKADSFDKCFRAVAALLKELCQRRK
jgi:hypothetical protein